MYREYVFFTYGVWGWCTPNLEILIFMAACNNHILSYEHEFGYAREPGIGYEKRKMQRESRLRALGADIRTKVI